MSWPLAPPSARPSLSSTASGVFSEWARLPTCVRERSTMRLLFSISALVSLASGSISAGKLPSSRCAVPSRTMASALRTRRKRLQAEQDGEGVDGDHADAEQREIGQEAALEAGDLLLQFGLVAHDAKARGAVLGIEDEFAFEHLQLLAMDAFGAIAALEAGVEGHLGDARRRNRLGHRRASAVRHGRPRRPAQPTSTSPNSVRKSADRRGPALPVSCAAFGNADRADQVEQMRRKQAVEAALAGLAVERGDEGEDDDQRQDRPQGREGNHAKRQRARPEPRRKRLGDDRF